ncbi:uncharacterized protein LOC124961936 [Sciurus carolinensis]|uniref:uncharacterized protein LOC124961936 n=1 Tax=Sciurus carolinensis TaxID=30640 RepID=UPI001FB4B74C|nr:uncharacterized protein LOC124961936 [Sciurus carolinensis]
MSSSPQMHMQRGQHGCSSLALLSSEDEQRPRGGCWQRGHSSEAAHRVRDLACVLAAWEGSLRLAAPRTSAHDPGPSAGEENGSQRWPTSSLSRSARLLLCPCLETCPLQPEAAGSRQHATRSTAAVDACDTPGAWVLGVEQHQGASQESMAEGQSHPCKNSERTRSGPTTPRFPTHPLNSGTRTRERLQACTPEALRLLIGAVELLVTIKES